MVMVFRIPRAIVREFINASDELDCKIRAGTPTWDENGRFRCLFLDNKDDKPFYRNPTDEHNVPRPRRTDNNERDNTNTDDGSPQPSPEPLPKPSPPPVTFDNQDRRPQPTPPTIEPPNTPPNIPDRRLPVSDDFITITIPSTPSSFALEKKLQSIKDDALSRTYGCMLHSPITKSPAIYRICEEDSSALNQEDFIKDDAKKFFEFLIKTLKQTAIGDALTGACVLTLNLLPSNFLRFLPNTQLMTVFGCSYLSNLATEFLFSSNNAYQSIDGQGHINVEYIHCTPDDSNRSGNFTEGIKPKDSNINECFVPIRNFKNNEPEQLGMKTQLQIIYELSEEIPDTDPVEYKIWTKQISIPSPKEDLDSEDIKDVFPASLKFGEIKAEFSVEPYGYVRFYANETDVDNEDTDNLFDDIVDILIEGDEKENSRRYSKRTRNIKTGEFIRKKAFLFKWIANNGEPPLCSVFNLS